MKYPRPKEPGLIDAKVCAALDAGWVCIYDRTKGGPKEFEAAAKAGNKAFTRAATQRYVLLYRPCPEEARTWVTPGKWVGTAKLGEARQWQAAICAGDDERGVLPVADGTAMGGLNHRQFAYCQLRLTGKTQAEAYKLAGYTGKNPDSDACNLEKNPRISKYIELHRAKEVKAYTKSKEDMLVWLDEMMEAVDEDRIKPEHQLTAADKIIKMKGWNEADKAMDKQAAAIAAMAEVLKQNLAKKKP
jgi:phage terminase small subunit